MSRIGNRTGGGTFQTSRQSGNNVANRGNSILNEALPVRSALREFRPTSSTCSKRFAEALAERTHQRSVYPELMDYVVPNAVS
jgi:hypothetical protein